MCPNTPASAPPYNSLLPHLLTAANMQNTITGPMLAPALSLSSLPAVLYIHVVAAFLSFPQLGHDLLPPEVCVNRTLPSTQRLLYWGAFSNYPKSGSVLFLCVLTVPPHMNYNCFLLKMGRTGSQDLPLNKCSTDVSINQ